LNNQEKEGRQVSQSSKSSAYYSVQEFAELAGVSKQAVYERIKRDLKGYTRKEFGRTMISGEALQFVGNKEESNGLMFELDEKSSQDNELEQSSQLLEQESKAINQLKEEIDQLNQATAPELKKTLSFGEYLNTKEGMLEYLISDLEHLRNDIVRLHGEIDRLNKVIAEKDARIAEFAERFAGLAEKEQEISSNALRTAGQAQMLHAMSEQPEAIDAPQEPQKAEKKRPWWKMKK
jgi:predicted DNA-binding protein YlxM (UPF0122 family)